MRTCRLNNAGFTGFSYFSVARAGGKALQIADIILPAENL